MKKYGVIITFLAMGVLLLAMSLGTASAAPDGYSDPHVTHLFEIEINGVSVGHFEEVEGLSIIQEVIEYQNGDDPLTRKRPGRITYGDITLKRGYVATSVLNDWIEAAKFGNGDYTRKNMAIVLLDEKQNEIKRWNCFEAFPRSWTLIPLEGQTGDILVEEMVIVIEWFEEA